MTSYKDKLKGEIMGLDTIIYFGLPPNSDRASGYSKWFFPVYDQIVESEVFNVNFMGYNNRIFNERTGHLTKFALPYLTLQLRKEMTGDRNIVHVLRQNSWFKDLFIASKLLAKKNVVNIITVHDIFKADGAIDYEIRKNIGEVDAIFCPSEFTKQSLTQHFDVHCPIYVTHNPLDQRYHAIDRNMDRTGLRKVVKTIRNRTLNDERIVMTASSEMSRKNLEPLLRVISILNENEPTFLLKVGRPTHNRQKYLRLAEELGITDRILWIDWASEEDLIKYYLISDLFVTLSEGEGFCMPLIEAMACGVPVVAANATAIPEIMGGAGALVDPRDLVDISEKCERILSDDRLSEEMKEKGKKRCDTFSVKKVSDRYLNAYLDLLT